MEKGSSFLIQNSPLLFPIPSQINPVHDLQAYLHMIQFILPSMSGSTSDRFPSDFPTKILHAFIFSPTGVTEPL
jgi:hypothetical protein